MAWVASLFSFVYCMIIVFKTFFGEYKGRHNDTMQLHSSIVMLILPIILGLFVVGIFFFPNLVGKYLIYPALGHIFPSMTLQLDAYSITAWHGFNTELLMTIAIVLVGGSLYLTLRHWRGVYRLFPETRSFDAVYNRSLSGMEKGSAKLTKLYMTGFLRDYLVYIYLFLVAVTGAVFIYTGAFSFDLSQDSPVSTYE